MENISKAAPLITETPNDAAFTIELITEEDTDRVLEMLKTYFFKVRYKERKPWNLKILLKNSFHSFMYNKN